jgi:hypothetical protein
MAGGFNHNFRYQGEVFHVQTEDSGSKSARVVTLLFRGGTILAAEKYSYADLVGRGDLPRLVEERMKEQHKEMMRRLKAGEFDEAIGRAAEAGSLDVAVQPLADLAAEEAMAASDDFPDHEVRQLPEGDLEALVFSYLTANDSRYQESSAPGENPRNPKPSRNH